MWYYNYDYSEPHRLLISVMNCRYCNWMDAIQFLYIQNINRKFDFMKINKMLVFRYRNKPTTVHQPYRRIQVSFRENCCISMSWLQSIVGSLAKSDQFVFFAFFLYSQQLDSRQKTNTPVNELRSKSDSVCYWHRNQNQSSKIQSRISFINFKFTSHTRLTKWWIYFVIIKWISCSEMNCRLFFVLSHKRKKNKEFI